MISLRKLASLSDGTRRRKLASLLKDFELAIVRGEPFDRCYLANLLDMVAADGFWPESLRNISGIGR